MKFKDISCTPAKEVLKTTAKIVGFGTLGALCIGGAVLINSFAGSNVSPDLTKHVSMAAGVGGLFTAAARALGGKNMGRCLLGFYGGPAVLMAGLSYFLTKAAGFGSFTLGAAMFGVAAPTNSQVGFWGCVALGTVLGVSYARSEIKKLARGPHQEPKL